MRVCFIGHRKIDKSEELISSLRETIVALISKGATTFLFGSRSKFDDLCWEEVTELRAQFPFIKRVYVRSAYQYISKIYEEYLLEFYEETYFPAKLENAGRASYVERNQEMINISDFCVFYYNTEYKPPLRKQSRSALSAYQPKSGTKLAYEYALKKGKEIINLYK